MPYVIWHNAFCALQANMDANAGLLQLVYKGIANKSRTASGSSASTNIPVVPAGWPGRLVAARVYGSRYGCTHLEPVAARLHDTASRAGNGSEVACNFTEDEWHKVGGMGCLVEPSSSLCTLVGGSACLMIEFFLFALHVATTVLHPRPAHARGSANMQQFHVCLCSASIVVQIEAYLGLSSEDCERLRTLAASIKAKNESRAQVWPIVRLLRHCNFAETRFQLLAYMLG
jgi:hypothetical protein